MILKQEFLLKRITLACVLIIVLLGGLALWGWLSNSLIFASFNQDFIPMAPSTALVFIAAGFALYFYRYTVKSYFAKIFVFAVVFLILFVCVLILIRPMSVQGVDVERWTSFHPQLTWSTLLNSRAPIGRMSPVTAANFLLVTLSLFLITCFQNKRHACKVAAVLSFFVVLFASIIMISYLYGPPLLYSVSIIPMALTTGIAFFFLGIGLIVAAGTDVWPLNIFTGLSIRARLMRAFSPLIFIIILFYGWYDTIVFRHVGNEVFALAVFAVLCFVLVNMLISEKSKIISREIEKAEIDKRRAEDALRESEMHYQDLFENMLNGLAYCQMFFDKGRPQDFIYLDVNAAFEKLTGLKNVIGRKVSEVIPGFQQSDSKLFETYGRVAMTGVPERFESYVKALDMWFSVSVYSPERDHFVAVFDVITDRKKAEDALLRSEHKFRSIFDGASDGILLVDPETKRFVLANEMICRMLGYNKDEICNLTVADIHPEKDLPYVMGQFERQLAGEIELAVDTPCRRRDGSVFYADIKSFYLMMDDKKVLAGIFRDVTERNKSQDQVVESEARFRELFDNMSDCVAVYEAVDNGGDFIIKDFNKSAEKLENVKREEIMGRRVTEVFPGIKEFGLLDVIKRVYESGKPEHHPIKLYRDEKISGWRENYVYKLPTGEVIAVYSDVTKRKEAEEREREFVKERAKTEAERARAAELSIAYEELKKMESSLIQAEKLASIGQLSAGVAHELNSPLDGLISLLRSYRKNTEEGSTAHNELTVMLDAAEYMAGIVRQLVSFARESKGELVELHFNDIINNTLVFVSGLLEEKGITIKKDLDPNLFKIKGEKNQLQQVVLNLVNNASDASSRDSEVIVKTRNSEDGRSVVVEFIDNGIGIRPEDLSKIFDPFFTTKSTGKGLGLGLFVSQGIVTQHNANIAVESQWGHGTKVTITFPAVSEE